MGADVIDARIATLAGQQGLQDPMERFGKTLSLANLLQANQMGRMQMRQAQRQEVESQRLRDLLSQGDVTEEGLLKAGFLDQALRLGKDRREQAKLDAETRKNAADTSRIEADTRLKKIGAVRDVAQASFLAYEQALKSLPESQARQQADSVYRAGLQQVSGLFSPQELAGFSPAFDPNEARAALDRAKELEQQARLAQMEITKRGQDLSAETQRRGQDLTAATARRGQDLVDARSRELNTITKEEKAAQRKVEQTEKAVTKFSDTIQKEGIPELETAVSEAEGVMGRYKKGQVPGIGPLKNMAPAFMMSDEGRDVRQALAQVRNIVLHARSGAAVTDQELRRLVEEIGTGTGMSEDDIRRGLKKVRDRIDKIKQNMAAGVSDDVLETYQSRGGLPIKRGTNSGWSITVEK